MAGAGTQFKVPLTFQHRLPKQICGGYWVPTRVIDGQMEAAGHNGVIDDRPARKAATFRH